MTLKDLASPFRSLRAILAACICVNKTMRALHKSMRNIIRMSQRKSAYFTHRVMDSFGTSLSAFSTFARRLAVRLDAG